MRLPRSSGILLHLTSLPGRYGVGDLGAAARAFVELLAAARVGVWQVLPLGPTGVGDSPYQSFSTFAGNPLLIDPEGLVADGLLEAHDLADPPAFPADRVDYLAVLPWKRGLLARAAERFRTAPPPRLRDAHAAFRRAHAEWLDDWALFAALKDAHGATSWTDWDPELTGRRPTALAAARARLADAVADHAFVQFVFYRQWEALRRHAGEHGIRILGDIPIFVAHDSADVWAHPELFFLDARGRQTVVAGVPPDYFSATGQRWGNPLYRWNVMARQNFRWWIARLRAALELVDLVRIDHFIGVTRYWEIPADAETAVTGRWVPGPGLRLLKALERALGPLAIVAEDLGAVTPEVDALRDRFALPGMKVLQFAFDGDPTNRHLPHLWQANAVAYTGTHDNDTTTGWFAAAPPEERARVQRYCARNGDEIAWDLIRLAMASVADTAIVPAQDVLALGSEARMNLPGSGTGNWAWRMREGALGDWHRARLRELVEVYGRAR